MGIVSIYPYKRFRNGLKITTPEEQFTLISSTPQEKVSPLWYFLSVFGLDVFVCYGSKEEIKVVCLANDP